jgi:hypothetical protein
VEEDLALQIDAFLIMRNFLVIANAGSNGRKGLQSQQHFLALFLLVLHAFKR